MRKKIFAIAIIALGLSSCDDFLDINKNPNQTTVSTPELVLSNALNATAGSLFYNQMGAMWAGQWAPSGDVSGFVQEKTYDFNNTYGTGIWTGFYDILQDYKYVMDEAERVGAKTGTAAIAKIMSAFLYHKLVDTYNNVPYTDALQGTDVIRPSYDNGQTVYETIINNIDDAVAVLKALDAAPGDDVNPGAADIVFGGDYEKWVRFGNTLKLRLLLRQTEMPGRIAGYIQPELAQISGGFLEEDANASPGYLKTAGKQNPFWDNYYKSETDALRNNFNFYRSTAFIVSMLPAADTRRLYIVAPSGSNVQSVAAGSRVGVTYGDESSAAYSNASSGIGFGILKAYNMPMTLFTASESYFLQAEGVQRGILTSAKTAAELYAAGITASYKLLGIPDPDTATPTHETADQYIANTAPYDGTLAEIIEQKYIASIGYGGFEAWADYRRLGIPNVPLSIRAIKDNIPVRLYYPNQELQTNADNVAAQGNIDALTTRVFWDAN
jgi:hypothetical protein